MRQATRGRRTWLLLAVGIVGCAHTTSPSALDSLAPAPLELRRRYTGTYVYAGGEPERAAVVAAVETAVQQMSVFAMDFARSALMARAEIRESYSISFDEGGNVSVQSPGELPEVSPADGRPAATINRFGDESELSQRFLNAAFVQQGRTRNGGGRTTFELGADGNTMIVRRVMESSQLPRAVEYTLTYRRK